jgi:DNA invertase Pin-like site-specific DNA recombinase
MNAQKINIVCARLSKEDSQTGDSGSITNQTELLTKYEEGSGLTPILALQDDRFSKTSRARPIWQELMRRADAGNVQTILVKNLDRSGRDHRRLRRRRNPRRR